MRFKTTIASIVGATIVYLQAKWVIDSNDATFAANILVALWLSVNLATNYGKKR